MPDDYRWETTSKKNADGQEKHDKDKDVLIDDTNASKAIEVLLKCSKNIRILILLPPWDLVRAIRKFGDEKLCAIEEIIWLDHFILKVRNAQHLTTAIKTQKRQISSSLVYNIVELSIN